MNRWPHGRVIYQTTGSRVAVALCGGATLGTLSFLILDTLDRLYIGMQISFWTGEPLAVMAILFIIFLAWLLGISVFGGPVWFFMHRSGRWSCHHSMGLGAVLTSLAFFVVAIGVLMGPSHEDVTRQGSYFLQIEGWRDATPGTVAFALIGAAVGFVIWRIAYVRVDSHRSFD